jgi:DNA-binding beta-propeller fold protein YncE
MKILSSLTLCLSALGLFAEGAFAQPSSGQGPYKVLSTSQTMGSGGIDYVYADSEDRRLYIPRGGEVLVFDLDTLKSAGTIANARARGAAVDSKSGHGFCSSSPVVMWDTKTLQTIKTIDVQGRPDGILFEPSTSRVYVFSHVQPNATVIDSKDGTVVGTIDLGGAPEQAASDGKGHLYVDLEDKDKIAVVDVNTLKVTTQYDLGGKGGGPAGLALDVKNHILFALCREPANAVILDAEDGKIITTLPIGRGTDGGAFNPQTMEAFSSQGDGTLTIIKETSPTTFEVEQIVQTKSRAKTCTLDTKKNQIVLITTEPAPGPAGDVATGKAPAATATNPGASSDTNSRSRTSAEAATNGGPVMRADSAGKRGGRPPAGPAYLDILVVGR